MKFLYNLLVHVISISFIYATEEHTCEKDLIYAFADAYCLILQPISDNPHMFVGDARLSMNFSFCNGMGGEALISAYMGYTDSDFKNTAESYNSLNQILDPYFVPSTGYQSNGDVDNSRTVGLLVPSGTGIKLHGTQIYSTILFNKCIPNFDVIEDGYYKYFSCKCSHSCLGLILGVIIEKFEVKRQKDAQDAWVKDLVYDCLAGIKYSVFYENGVFRIAPSIALLFQAYGSTTISGYSHSTNASNKVLNSISLRRSIKSVLLFDIKFLINIKNYFSLGFSIYSRISERSLKIHQENLIGTKINNTVANAGDIIDSVLLFGAGVSLGLI